MDKLERLLDATAHPERYSKSEIDALLSDPEVKEVFDLLDKTKSSLTPIETPDVDAEWKTFERKHRNSTVASRFKIVNLFSRNVAAGIAIAIASFAAVAAVVGVSVNYFSGTKDVTEPTESQAVAVEVMAEPDTIAVLEDIAEIAPQTIVFDNEPLDSIISKITAYYGYKLIFDTDKSRELRLYFRWNQALPIEEVVESLNNFEQLRLTIDGNTIKVD